MDVTVRLEDFRPRILHTPGELDEADLCDAYLSLRSTELRRPITQVRSAQHRLYLARLHHGRQRYGSCRHVQSWSPDHSTIQFTTPKPS